jgi:hypothetical protein
VTSAPVDVLAEEWDHLDLDVLRPSRSGTISITCLYFSYALGRHYVARLNCPRFIKV